MDAILALDRQLLYSVQALPRPAWLVALSRWVDYDAAFYAPLLGLLILAAWIWPARRRRIGLALGAALLAYLVGGLVVKPLVDRPRPYQAHGDLKLALYRTSGDDSASFPSSHAGICFALAATLCAAERWSARWALLAAAALVAAMRVYGGAHYPLDVLGGAALGAASAFAALRLRPALEPVR